MIFYGSPEEEAGALRRAVLRAGCRLVSAAIGATEAGKRSIGKVECEDGWGAAKLVMALAAEDAKAPGARRLAAKLRMGAPDDRAFAHAIHAFVRRAIKFVREPGEIFQGPGYAFATGRGDCEDHARAVYAIAVAGGLPARLAFLHRGEGPTHAVAQVWLDGEPQWLETTVAAEVGEHPIKAARRLGLVEARGDIAEKERTMSENDLAPIPAGFLSANDPAQVERDAQALERLGYLVCADRVMGDPTNLDFRQAVLAFQTDKEIMRDGLVGPQTRRTIAGSLELDEFGMGYLAATQPPIVYSKHLSSDFFRAVEAMAQRMRDRGARNVTAEGLLSVWNGESGILKARQGNGGLPYFGLNMMHVSNVLAAGWKGPIEGYRDLPAEEQVPYVDRFYIMNVGRHWGDVTRPRDLYFINWLPAWWHEHRDDDDWVIAQDPKKFGAGAKDGWVYTGNPGFDPEKKGFIVVADIDRWIERAKNGDAKYWAEVVRRLQTEGGSAPSTSGSAGIVAGVVALVGVGALAAYHLSQS